MHRVLVLIQEIRIQLVDGGGEKALQLLRELFKYLRAEDLLLFEGAVSAFGCGHLVLAYGHLAEERLDQLQGVLQRVLDQVVWETGQQQHQDVAGVDGLHPALDLAVVQDQLLADLHGGLEQGGKGTGEDEDRLVLEGV